jgi:hypothetical protein
MPKSTISINSSASQRRRPKSVVSISTSRATRGSSRSGRSRRGGGSRGSRAARGSMVSGGQNTFRPGSIYSLSRLSASAVASQFAALLQDPFNPRCFGARVPDSFSLPTVTYHLRNTYTVTSTNANPGIVELVLMANPCLSLIVGQGTVSGLVTYNQNNQAGYLISPANLFGQVLNYRVVGWGVKLIAKDTAFAEKGRIYSAVLPNGGQQPSWEILNNHSASSEQVLSEYLVGYQIGSSTPTALQNYATCQSFSLQDLLNLGSMVMSVSPSHTDQFRFRSPLTNSALTWSTSLAIGQVGGYNPTGNTTYIDSQGNLEATSLVGSNCVVIYASGLPQNSNEFDLDVIYHIEATPNLNTSSVQLIPSGMDSAPGSTNTTETILAKAKRHTDAFIAGADRALGSLGTQALTFGGGMALHGARVAASTYLTNRNRQRRIRNE